MVYMLSKRNDYYGLEKRKKSYAFGYGELCRTVYNMALDF